MRVVSYMACLPKYSKSQEKIDALNKFIQGVCVNGDRGEVYHGTDIQDCDVAVILGWVHEDSRELPHLRLRRQIIEVQTKRRRRVVSIDSSLFLYTDHSNPYHYLRYSFDGIFPTTGEYCDHRPNPERWPRIARNLGIEVKPWRKTGDHIVLCLQRQGGWSMQGYNIIDWLANTIVTLREHTDRPIVIRPHPNDKAAPKLIGEFSRDGMLANVSISAPGTSLQRDLVNAWAMVNHNSSPTVGAAIEGIPIFVTNPENSQSRDIANTDLSKIETPVTPDREPWLHRLAQSHWNFRDLENGACWCHMRQFI